MSQFFRKRNVILKEDKKTVAFEFVFINEAKRKSLELQRAGNKVNRLANKAGVK